MSNRVCFKITAFVIIISILVSMLTVFAETESKTIIVEENFENGFVPNGWSAPEAMLGTFLRVEDGVLAMSCEDEATLRVSKDFTPVDTVCTYEFKFKTDASFINFAYTGGTGGVGMFFTLQNSVLTATFGDGSGNGTSQKFVVARGIRSDVWTKLKVEVAAIYNTIDSAITIYVNDEKVLTDVPLWQPLKNVSYFWFGLNAKGTLYIDDLTVAAVGDKYSFVNTAPERILRRVDKSVAKDVIEANDKLRLKGYSENVAETYIPIVAINPIAENGYHLSQTGVLYNSTDLYFNAPEEGNYAFTMRYGANAERTLGLNVNGMDLGNVVFKPTGSNQLRDFTDLSINLNLKKGENVIRLLGLGKGNVFFECFMLHSLEQITDGVFTEVVSADTRQFLPVTTFSDIEGHVFSEAINYCAESGFFKQKNGIFRPDEAITRQEFLEVLLNSLGYAFNSSDDYINKAIELSFMPEQLSDLNEINEPMVLLDARIFFEQVSKSGYFRDSIPFGEIISGLGMTCADTLTRGVCAKLFYDIHTGELTGYSYRRQAYLRMIMQKPKSSSNARSLTNWSLISLWFGENIKEANEILSDSKVTGMVTYEEFEGGNTPYWTIPSLFRIYYGFNQENGKYGKLLTRNTQNILLELMWNFANVYGDYVLGTGLDPNVVQGTENHTWHMTSSIYLASQQLAKNEYYKDKVFDNGYTAAEYVNMMEKYFFDLYKSKAGQGLFIEGSATYIAVSTQGIYNIMDFTENSKLAEATKMFLDIFWIEHGMESMNAVRGGGKTREYIRWAQVYNWALSSLASIYFDNKLPHLGDYADIETSLLSDYRPPQLAEMLSASPEERGRFEAVFRQPGIGTTVREEKTGVLMFPHSDTKSLLRYTYTTPNYVMGTFIRNNAVQYSVLSDQNRWEGVILKEPISGRIFPRFVSGETGAKAFVTMQKGPIMLGQRGQQRNVEIYVLPYVKTNAEGDVDLDDGWYFDEYKGVYYGIKAVTGTLTLSPSKHLLLTDSSSQFIIHMGDEEQDGTFEEFCSRLKNNEISYDDNEITYTDSVWGSMRLLAGTNMEEIRFIDGVAVNMNPEKVVDSPYLWGNFAEGKLYTKFEDETLLYDFTDFTVKKVENEGDNK